MTVLHFEYLYVGLPALDAEQYVHGDNWLGVALAALMRKRPERKIELRAEMLDRIGLSKENSFRRFLLSECVEAYMPLDAKDQQQFDHLVDARPYPGVRAVGLTSFDKGQRHIVCKMLGKRFGALAPPVLERLNALSRERLEELAARLFEASSLRELGLED